MLWVALPPSQYRIHFLICQITEMRRNIGHHIRKERVHAWPLADEEVRADLFIFGADIRRAYRFEFWFLGRHVADTLETIMINDSGEWRMENLGYVLF